MENIPHGESSLYYIYIYIYIFAYRQEKFHSGTLILVLFTVLALKTGIKLSGLLYDMQKLEIFNPQNKCMDDNDKHVTMTTNLCYTVAIYAYNIY